MVDFKQGDDIVCVDDGGLRPDEPRCGVTYIAGKIERAGGGTVFVQIPGFPDGGLGFYARRFRKVERKSDSLSIEAFRTIKDGGFEEPKRTNQPAKRKEQA